MNDMNPTMDKNARANSHLIQSMLVAASSSIRIHRMESNFKSNPCHIGHRMIHWLGIVDHPTSHISASLVGFKTPASQNLLGKKTNKGNPIRSKNPKCFQTFGRVGWKEPSLCWCPEFCWGYHLVLLHWLLWERSFGATPQEDSDRQAPKKRMFAPRKIEW